MSCDHATCVRKEGTAELQSSFCKAEFNSRMYTSCQELVSMLRREGLKAAPPGEFHSQETIEHIRHVLSRVSLNKTEWSQYASFNPKKYTRNLIGYDKEFTVLLLCWNKDQVSPVHDHAGSSCWVKVLQGELQEVRYGTAKDGTLEVTNTVTAKKDEVCYINDTMGYHTMGNPRSDEVCVSMHIYSPPFSKCTIFTLDGMSRCASMLAANCPYIEEVHGGSFSGGSNLLNSPRTPALSLNDLVNELNELGTKHEASNEASWQSAVHQLLKGVTFTREEWEVYTHFSEIAYQRNLVFLSEYFSVMVNCWMPGQGTPLHTHGDGTHTWTRVLNGSLVYTEYNEDRKTPMGAPTPLTTETEPYHEPSGRPIHELRNAADSEVAITMHIYYPPYKEVIDSNSTDRTVPVVCYGTKECGEDLTTCRATAGGSLYTNFKALPQLLKSAFKNCDPMRICPEACSTVIAVLERCQFNSDEVQEFWDSKEETGNRIILHNDDKFSVVLNLWDRGHASETHDHAGSATWVKCLEGTITDVNYERSCRGELNICRTALLQPNGLSYLGPNVIHSMRCGSTTPSATLHVYSPPFTQCHCYSAEGGVQRKILQVREFSPPLAPVGSPTAVPEVKL